MKILVVGHYHSATGYATVVENICKQLCKRHEVHLFALNHNAQFDQKEKWQVYQNTLIGDDYGFYSLADILKNVDPQILLVVHDLFTAGDYAKVVRECPKKPKLIFYGPIEGRNLPDGEINILRDLDSLVLFTEFAKEEVCTGFNGLDKYSNSYNNPPISVIPHGVDQKNFYSIDKAVARSQIWKESKNLNDLFIVLNANRNSPRKRLDLTLEGFALFAKSAPEARLCLHCGTRDIGYDLIRMIKHLGIEHQVIWTSLDKWHPRFTKDHLNLVYNACDVGINTSYGEGWGLIAFEHGITEAAQIVPDHSACSELWKEAGVLLKGTRSFKEEFSSIEYSEVSVKSVVETLTMLYNDPDFLTERSKSASKLASQPKFNWDKIGKKWELLIEEVMNN